MKHESHVSAESLQVLANAPFHSPLDPSPECREARAKTEGACMKIIREHFDTVDSGRERTFGIGADRWGNL
jgi:hypothetical protein